MGALQALLRAGADVDAPTETGATPIMQTEDPEIIKALLRGGADIKLGNYKSDAWVAIVHAEYSKLRGLQYLRNREGGALRGTRNREGGRVDESWSEWCAHKASSIRQ
jgi:hypothetical protein